MRGTAALLLNIFLVNSALAQEPAPTLHRFEYADNVDSFDGTVRHTIIAVANGFGVGISCGRTSVTLFFGNDREPRLRRTGLLEWRFDDGEIQSSEALIRGTWASILDRQGDNLRQRFLQDLSSATRLRARMMAATGRVYTLDIPVIGASAAVDRLMRACADDAPATPNKAPSLGQQ